MERVYLSEVRKHLGEEILVQGFVENFRNGKSMAFIVLKDITGKLQITVEKEKLPEIAEAIEPLTGDSVISVTGIVYESEYVKLNGLEMIPSSVKVESIAAALPIQMSDSGRYDTAIKQEILKVKDTVMNDPEIPAKFKRKEIVRRLNDTGVFKVKNAIQICADTLDITIATIYMHIRNLDAN